MVKQEDHKTKSKIKLKFRTNLELVRNPNLGLKRTLNLCKQTNSKKQIILSYLIKINLNFSLTLSSKNDKQFLNLYHSN